MPEKTPQDRKPKEPGYQFTVAGKAHRLPTVGDSDAAAIPGDVTYAAIMEPDNEMAQMRLGFAMLEAAKPTPAAMKALKSLSTKDMLEHLGRWMGESTGSSD